ncbi:MAG: YebC/PmpR family DNA-binding transcriptional regulator [Candidatus Dojkabacteria bacterium]|nr:YebC/PmpR family DNA-binding transcriptional regulator [Candidatus Dojkabacteria bacterium]
MAGHSKWAQIKRKKAANDAQKAKEFTRVSRLITLAVQQGGPDPEFNSSLAFAIEKAREINLPKDNIERSIKRGLGSSNEGRLETIVYEAYSPDKVAMLIFCTTDNKNRTLGEIRSIVEKNGGTFASAGAVSWQFDVVGYIFIPFGDNTNDEKNWNKVNEKKYLEKDKVEEFVLALMESNGILDVSILDDGVQVMTDFQYLNEIRNNISNQYGLYIDSAEETRIPNVTIDINKDQYDRLESLIEKLEMHEDVQKVWHNGVLVE